MDACARAPTAIRTSPAVRYGRSLWRFRSVCRPSPLRPTFGCCRADSYGTTVPNRSASSPRPLLPPRWSGVLVSQVNVTTPGRFACAASHGGVRARARSTDGGRGCTQVRRSLAANPRTRGSGLRRPWPIRRFDSRAVGSKAEGELCTDEANMARIVSRDASTRTPGAMVPLVAGPLAATGPALVSRARYSAAAHGPRPPLHEHAGSGPAQVGGQPQVLAANPSTWARPGTRCSTGSAHRHRAPRRTPERDRARPEIPDG